MAKTKKPLGVRKKKYKKRILTHQEKAERIAKLLLKNWYKYEKAGANFTRYMAGRDPWGPSLQDMKDGTNKQLDLITNAILKGMK